MGWSLPVWSPPANGTAERRASETMLKAKAKEAGKRITAGEDKAYDTAVHVANLRALNVTPHVTQNHSLTSTGKHRRSAIDARTARQDSYGMSQSRRAMIECIFGWGQQQGSSTWRPCSPEPVSPILLLRGDFSRQHSPLVENSQSPARLVV